MNNIVTTTSITLSGASADLIIDALRGLADTLEHDGDESAARTADALADDVLSQYDAASMARLNA